MNFDNKLNSHLFYLPEEIIIEIIINLNINVIIKLMLTNNYYHNLIINNNLLINKLIDSYKLLNEDDLIDDLIDNTNEDHILTLFNIVFHINPNIIYHNNIISNALESFYSPHILQYLINHGLNIKDKFYDKSYLEHVIFEINDLDQKMWSDPIKDIAIDYGKIVEILLEEGADPNEIINENNGDTVFHLLIRGRLSIYLLELFLQFGADPNIQNDLGNTPFYDLYTYHWDNQLLIDMMKEYGADTNIRNKEGYKCNHNT